MRRRVALAALVVLALAGSAPAAGAQARASLPDIEDEVMCRVCGTPLNLANGPYAERQRALIRRLIAGGRTKAQIKDALVAEYGEGVLALPERRGFNLAVYLVPVGVVLAALAALALALPRWRRRPPGGPPAAPELEPAAARHLDEDLARYDL